MLALHVHHACARIVCVEPCADVIRRSLRQIVVIVVVLLHIGYFLHQHTGCGVIEFHLGLNTRFLFLHLNDVKRLGVVRSLQEIHLVVLHPRRL